MKQTDLNNVKEMARCFVYLSIDKTEISPFIIIHPIFSNALYHIEKNGNIELINIITDENNLKIAREDICEKINQCKNAYQVFCFIRKPSRLTFLKYTQQYLSNKDMSNILRMSWQGSESPNKDINVSLEEMIDLFRKSDKNILMQKKELNFYNKLPNTVIIYRGVGDNSNPFGLSWTIDREVAIWFANRFKSFHKKVIKASIEKKHIFAYFNNMSESELIVDTKYIKIISEGE